MIQVVKVGDALPNRAIWTPPLVYADTYRVQAYWLNGTYANSVRYTIEHAGGSTEVTRSQNYTGTGWHDLGAFAFSPGAGHRVSLSDQAPYWVHADAVLLLPEATAERVARWDLAPAAPGSYQVYAKWVPEAGRAPDAAYRVVHAGGTSTLHLDQRAGGAGWVGLGAYDFAAGTGGAVSLAASYAGSVSADALRFVKAEPAAPAAATREVVALDGRPLALLSGGGPGATLAYVHPDHLGAPQAMTDAAGAIVWERAQRPYGETVSLNGTAANPQRFPGQYADAETGYHQNWFRDYDSATGRYLQSDPIGVEGGLNTYAYVAGNPVRFADTIGEAVDTIGDFIFIGYDLYRIGRDNIIGNCGNLGENLLALGGDIVGAIIPGLTRVGLAIRNISKSNNPIWKYLKPWRGQTKTNGQSGRKREYYE